MRSWITIIVLSVLLVGSVVLYATCWQTWFGQEEPPQWPIEQRWSSDSLVVRYEGPETVPGEHYYMDSPSERLIVVDAAPLVRLVYLTRTLTWVRTLMCTQPERRTIIVMKHQHPVSYVMFYFALRDADIALTQPDVNDD